MLASFRKITAVISLCFGIAALAQIPGTFPFAFLRSKLTETCETGSQAFGVGSSTNMNDGVYDFTVPSGCQKVTVKAWGAGGGAQCAYNDYGDPHGGSGGFSQARLSVTPGQALKIVVGSGGRSNSNVSNGNNIGSFGGPGIGSIQPLGGGYSGVHGASGTLTQGNALLIAGGGGSAGSNRGYAHGGDDAGGGGGFYGQTAKDGVGGSSPATGGTQAAGGAGAASGTALKGADSTTSGGAGGGGYFGGGSGAGNESGGGGSGYVIPSASHAFTAMANYRSVPYSGDSNYAGNAGLGGLGVNAAWNLACAGQNGRVVISWGEMESIPSVIISSDITINTWNALDYLYKDVTIAANVTVTVDLEMLPLNSLTMLGNAKMVLTSGKALNLDIATNLTVAQNAKIDADGKGYAPGYTYESASSGTSSGGSHGGFGGKQLYGGPPNEVYGSLENPVTAGSGGYSSGAGGGVIRINVADAFLLNGIITANGTAGTSTSHGGGAGGSIWITAGSIESSSTSLNITASGGAGTGTNASGGGGGRIAIYYGSLTGFAVDSTRVRAYGGGGQATYHGGAGTIYSKQLLATTGDLLIAGPHYSNYKNTKIGVFGQISSISTTTLVATYPILPGLGASTSLAGKTLKPDIAQEATRAVASGTNSSVVASSTLAGLTSASKYFYISDYESQFRHIKISGAARVDAGFLTASEDLEIIDTAVLSAYDLETKNTIAGPGAVLSVLQSATTMGAVTLDSTAVDVPAWTIGGNAVFNGASVVQTNTLAIVGNLTVNGNSYGRIEALSVGGNLTLNASSRLVPRDPTSSNVFGLHVTAKSLTLTTGARIDSDGKGYLGSRTYGNVSYSSLGGGSHGGYGGRINSSYTPPELYGSLENPVTAGSGGSVSGAGGGVIKINVADAFLLNGIITANGTEGTGTGYGGGAGGSIWITAGSIESSSTSLNITASGGAGTGTNASGGGGGRIAIYYGSLTGFAVDSTRVRAYGGGGQATYHGGAGTVFSKQDSELYGDLLISDPKVPSYKNTRIGVFGQVSSISTNTLNSYNNLLPGQGASTVLSGKILKPDINLPGSIALSASTNTSLTTVGSLVGLTTPLKYYYILDYETTFKKVTIEGNARLDTGYLNVLDILSLGAATVINNYEMDANQVVALSGAAITSLRTVEIYGNMDTTNTSLNVGKQMYVDGNWTDDTSVVDVGEAVDVGGSIYLTASHLNIPNLTVGLNAQFDGGGDLLMSNAIVIGNLTLSDGFKIYPYAPTATNVYGLDITAQNMYLGTNTLIDTNGKGYLAGRTNGNTATGAAVNSGGSYGGYGGRVITHTPNEIYGSFLEPDHSGAGGAGIGIGGGKVRLKISGMLTLNGIVSANGTDGTCTSCGGGAGGSIWITAGTIVSSVSIANVTASGGAGTGTNAGGGGGGRIAIYYGNLSGFSMDSNRVQAFGGSAGTTAQGGAGTIYSSNTTNGQSALLISGSNRFSSYARTKVTLTAPLSLDLLRIENSAQVRQANNTYNLIINVLEIQNSGTLDVPTNGVAGFGEWFQYSILVGAPVPSEY